MCGARLGATVSAAVLNIAFCGLAVAETFDVPGDFATIQGCINLAVSGVDECLVAPGTYNEKINFLGKVLTVRSESGPENCIIDREGSRRGMWFRTSEPTAQLSADTGFAKRAARIGMQSAATQDRDDLRKGWKDD